MTIDDYSRQALTYATTVSHDASAVPMLCAGAGVSLSIM